MLLPGCRPKGILTTRQMRSVLHDLHRADAILQVSGYSYGHDEEVARYYGEVLEQHGITQAQFDSSIVWYTDHPYIYRTVYPRLIQRLEAEEEEQRIELGMAKERPDVMQAMPLDSCLDLYRNGLPLPHWFMQTPESGAADGDSARCYVLLPEYRDSIAPVASAEEDGDSIAVAAPDAPIGKVRAPHSVLLRTK